jgi:hypothetical protein
MVGDGANTQGYLDTLISFSIFMLDSRNMLSNREESLALLQKYIREIPDTLRNLLITQLSELNRRSTEALALTEAYTLENVSRYRWGQQ